MRFRETTNEMGNEMKSERIKAIKGGAFDAYATSRENDTLE